MFYAFVEDPAVQRQILADKPACLDGADLL
jgi:hypothetical protein